MHWCCIVTLAAVPHAPMCCNISNSQYHGSFHLHTLVFAGSVSPTAKELQPKWTATGSNWTSSCSCELLKNLQLQLLKNGNFCNWLHCSCWPWGLTAALSSSNLLIHPFDNEYYLFLPENPVAQLQKNCNPTGLQLVATGSNWTSSCSCELLKNLQLQLVKNGNFCNWLQLQLLILGGSNPTQPDFQSLANTVTWIPQF